MAATGPGNVPKRKDSYPHRMQAYLTQLWNQAKSVENTTIIYILLALGLILLLAWPWVGGAIIGLVAGYVFCDEIIARAISTKRAIEQEEVTRGVVLGVVLIAFFLEAPAIVIGAAVAIAIRRLIGRG